MLAFGLSIAIFLYWTVIGAAVVFTLRRRPNLLQNFLLSPVVGACTIVLMAFWLSRLGLRVSTFGPPLVAGMLLAALIALWFNRVKLPVRRALPFAALLLLSALLTGRPMFEFGFNWVSISHDDMTNYCLLAQRLLRYGYFEGLSNTELALNRDMSAYYWFMHVQDGARCGGDLMLSVVTSISGRSVHECFMPLILALQLALVSVSTALALSDRRIRKYALGVMLLLCCSALTSLGMLYQILAQVFGLSVLARSALLLMDEPAASKWSRSFRSPSWPRLRFHSVYRVFRNYAVPFRRRGASFCSQSNNETIDSDDPPLALFGGWSHLPGFPEYISHSVSAVHSVSDCHGLQPVFDREARRSFSVLSSAQWAGPVLGNVSSHAIAVRALPFARNRGRRPPLTYGLGGDGFADMAGFSPGLYGGRHAC